MKKEKLTQDVIYPHPAQRVWTALTRSNELAQWLLPNDFAARVGHRFTFTRHTVGPGSTAPTIYRPAHHT